jgi:lipopolysaccharide biosynthesis regulator YciM
MSFWVATQVVTASSSKTRVELIEKFIAISSKLYKYRNYFGVFEILSGLHNANVRRLKSCWKQVSYRSTNILDRLERAMSHIGNYAQYRSCVKECQEKRTAAVPLVCLLLQDLTFINDGNEDITSEGKVNLEKWALFGSCMANFSRLMEARYNFHKNTSIKKMLQNDLLILPETLLMKHSYAIEARKRYPSHGTSF